MYEKLQLKGVNNYLKIKRLLYVNEVTGIFLFSQQGPLKQQLFNHKQQRSRSLIENTEMLIIIKGAAFPIALFIIYGYICINCN